MNDASLEKYKNVIATIPDQIGQPDEANLILGKLKIIGMICDWTGVCKDDLRAVGADLKLLDQKYRDQLPPACQTAMDDLRNTLLQKINIAPSTRPEFKPLPQLTSPPAPALKPDAQA